MTKIPVILLNYNSVQDCRKCIGFLKRQEGVELEIIIVDNCSKREGEQETLKQLMEESGCTFIAATENRGYNAGNNIGLRYAAEKGYKYAVIANPDMEFPQSDYFKCLVRVMEKDNNVAIVGSDIRDAEGLQQNPLELVSFWDEFLWPISMIKFKLSGKSLATQQKQLEKGYCNVVSGSCLLVRVDFIKGIGYFDENVFLYCEEAILSNQVKKANKKIYYLPDAVAIHRHIKNEKGNPYKRLILLCNSRDYKNKYHSNYNHFQIALLHFSNVIRRFYLRFKM